jgi:hypothetical protein
LSEPRFYVQTTTGYATDRKGTGHGEPGVSALVLERGGTHRLVYQARSEEIGNSTKHGQTGEAIRRAQTVADALNLGGTMMDALDVALPHGVVERVDHFGVDCPKCQVADYKRRKRAEARK